MSDDYGYAVEDKLAELGRHITDAKAADEGIKQVLKIAEDTLEGYGIKTKREFTIPEANGLYVDVRCGIRRTCAFSVRIWNIVDMNTIKKFLTRLLTQGYHLSCHDDYPNSGSRVYTYWYCPDGGNRFDYDKGAYSFTVEAFLDATNKICSYVKVGEQMQPIMELQCGGTNVPELGEAFVAPDTGDEV